MRLFNTPEINQGCRNRDGGQGGGATALRFWQISYPYLSQGRGADYARHSTNCPPVFSYPPTALLTDDCLVTISYKKRQQLQFKCTVVLVFGLVWFFLRKLLKSMLIIIILFFKSQKTNIASLGFCQIHTQI